MDDSLHVAFCGGGSGGHLTPAMCIAEALWASRPDAQISFFSSGRDIDQRILMNWQPQNDVTVTALPVYSSGRRLRYCLQVCRATAGCIRTFRRNRPDVVLGLGGFASVPGIVAAAYGGIPIALFEANVIPGRANRRLARWAALTISGWPMGRETQLQWPTKIVETGVPVKDGFAQQKTTDHQTLLVLGGSLGAGRVNQLAAAALTSSETLPKGWQIIHQTGPDDHSRIKKVYAAAGANAVVEPFLHDVADAMLRADLVISRCGATTLAEIAAAGRAAILIPLMSSADNHQSANATLFAENHAAVMLDETDDECEKRLAAKIAELCGSQDQRQKMERRARQNARPDAARAVAEAVIQLATTAVTA